MGTVSRTILREQVKEILLERILRRELQPGDRLVEVRTRDFCDKSVGAVLGYPVRYDFAYTWFHEAEWEVGNRRSICWAKTDR